MPDENKVVAIIDVETTGTDTTKDEVIEFAVQKGFGKDAYRKAWRFKPSRPIPKESTAIHGITDADVANSPPFSSAVAMVRKIIEGSDAIVGYNVGFDLDMLQAEFMRLKEPVLNLTVKAIVDPLELWRRSEPRTLSDAVRRFAKREHDGAHAALADVEATGEVLLGMLDAFSLKDSNWEELSDPKQKGKIGGTGQIVWKDGEIIFNFGKNRGKHVFSTIKEDVSYAKWICGQDFPEHVKAIVNSAAKLEKEEFISFVKVEFGEG